MTKSKNISLMKKIRDKKSMIETIKKKIKKSLMKNLKKKKKLQ